MARGNEGTEHGELVGIICHAGDSAVIRLLTIAAKSARTVNRPRRASIQAWEAVQSSPKYTD